MNLPNTLTVIRVLLTFATIVLLVAANACPYAALTAFAVYVVAGATDWFDGYLARKFGAVTVFGKFMDAISDKIMVTALFMALFALGIYANWTVAALACAVLSVSREFAVSGLRMVASSKGIVLAAEWIGKFKAGFQMYSIGSAIFAYSLAVDFSAQGCFLWQLAFYGAVGTLVVSTVLSVWSGVSYLCKYGYMFKE